MKLNINIKNFQIHCDNINVYEKTYGALGMAYLNKLYFLTAVMKHFEPHLTKSALKLGIEEAKKLALEASLAGTYPEQYLQEDFEVFYKTVGQDIMLDADLLININEHLPIA